MRETFRSSGRGFGGGLTNPVLWASRVETLSATGRVGVVDENWRSLAERTSNRIRLLQADLADSDSEGRRSVVAEEIRAALERLIPQEKELFLAAIEERFPAWESEAMVQVSQPTSAASVSATDMAEFRDPSFLIQQLRKLAPQMTADQRERAAIQLAEAGIRSGGGGGGNVSDQALGRVRAVMQLPPDAPVDMERLMMVVPTVLEKLAVIDEHAAKNWAQLSQVKRAGHRSTVARNMGLFVSGDAAVGRVQLDEELESMRKLTCAMFFALGYSGRAAFEQMQKLHPDRAMIGISGMLAEAKYWRKYCELAKDKIDAVVVESEMLRVLAGVVNDMLSGKSR